MSNLATMIMEGSGIGGFKATLSHSYDHENGAGLIAMESAEALRDIFEAEFYVPNTCTIAAALEGASCVEESSQAAIMEASVKGAFAKIKQFFIDLKEKVKDFLHNIKRYLTGIFGNDEKWVKTYEKELNALSDADLKGYEVKMYKYSIIEALSKADIEKLNGELLDTAKKDMADMFTSAIKGGKNMDESDVDADFKDKYENALKDMVGDTDPDAIQKNAWSMMRSGADSDKDKETVSVGKSQIAAYVAAIKSGSKDISAYDNMITKVNKAYDKAVKFIDDCEKKVKSAPVGDNGLQTVNRDAAGIPKKSGGGEDIKINSATASNYAMLLRKYSAFTSKIQSAHNTVNTAAKSAMQERNSAYKKALVGAFAYAKKNKGGK